MSFQFEPDEEEEDGSRRTTAVVLGMVAAFLIAVPLIILLVFVRGGGDNGNPTPTASTQVVFDDPRTGDNLQLGQEYEILVSAEDPVGIESIELKVGGRSIEILGGEEGVGEPPQFTFHWTPDRIGSRRLDVEATNLNGDISEQVSITVNVVDGDETPTPGETETETPTPGEADTETPTETPTGTETPREGAFAGILNQGANVRQEADENSNLVGTLPAGAEVEVVGRDEDGVWLQIIFPFGTDERAWVFGQFIDVDGDPFDLPVESTATPTETPTEEPTETPTETPTEETGIDLEPIGLTVGTGNALVVTVANNGPADFEGGSASINVQFDDGGDLDTTVSYDLPVIGAGDNTTISIDSVIVDSSVSVRVLVDSTNDIAETDNDNNLITATLGPAAEADLELTGFDIAGDDNHFQVTVTNVGEADVVGASLVISVSSRAGAIGTASRTLDLAVGETIVLDLDEITLDQERRITVQLDPDETIPDQDRSNNSDTRDVSP